MAISERLKEAMTPDTPKREDELADAIDRWEEEERKLEMLGSEYVMPAPFLKTVLGNIMDVGKAKDHFEMLASQHKQWE